MVWLLGALLKQSTHTSTSTSASTNQLECKLTFLTPYLHNINAQGNKWLQINHQQCTCTAGATSWCHKLQKKTELNRIERNEAKLNNLGTLSNPSLKMQSHHRPVCSSSVCLLVLFTIKHNPLHVSLTHSLITIIIINYNNNIEFVRQQ